MAFSIDACGKIIEDRNSRCEKSENRPVNGKCSGTQNLRVISRDVENL